MARLAPRRRDDAHHTPSSVIDLETIDDTDSEDVATYVAMSIPRVSDRQWPRYEEPGAWL